MFRTALKDRTGMMSQISTLYQSLWMWTFGGLPGWLVLPGFRRKWSKEILIDSFPIHEAQFSKGDVLDVALARSLFLQKTLVLPVAARKNLDRIVDLNIRQSSPAEGGDVVWRYVIETISRNELTVRIFLLKKRLLDELVSDIPERGAKLRSVVVADSISAKRLLDNRRETDRILWFWWLAVVFLVAVQIAAFNWRENHETRQLKERVSALEEEQSELSDIAVSLRELSEKNNSNLDTNKRDIALFLAEFQQLPILLGLTEALPDETWISELSIDGGELRLSGFSGSDVSDVIAQIRALPWVKRVALDGPVIFDRISQRSRFDLTVAISPALKGKL